MGEMQDTTLSYRAGWSRVAMAVAGVTLLPIAFAPLGQYRWVFGVYFLFALAIQFAIKKNIGGSIRIVAGGMVDIAQLTFFVHLLGSSDNVLPAIYILIAVMNTLAVGQRLAMPVVLMAIAAYAGVQTAEQFGLLPYAPEALAEIPPAMPSASTALGQALLLTAMVLVATTQVGKLVAMMRKHENELEAANAQLEELSQRDPLTQLFNRRYLVGQIDHELERVRRGHPLSLLMIDLDRFKHVNDERGHLAGDNVLREIATALEETTRATDVAARYGGDEFMVVLTDTDHERAQLVAGRLVENVREAVESVEPGAGVTASVGIAIARPTDSVRSLTSRSDEQVYKAKQAGGDRFVAEPDETAQAS